MKGFRIVPSIVAPLLLLLTGCWNNHQFEPPAAKTNPDPRQRYEITVELVDPPADIRKISGVAHFGIPNVICMPTPDRIAGYTPSAGYKKEFPLTQADKNIYKGHIYLDWPIDEDYYGRGVCKWQFAGADTILTRANGFTQLANINSSEITSESWNLSYCREIMRDKYDNICSTPLDPGRVKFHENVSYRVKMSSRKK